MPRKLLYALLLIIHSINVFSQSGFNLGVGGGSTHYYGSLHDNNIKYNVGADVRYDFNQRYSASFSFHNTALQGYRYNETGSPSCYFNTTSNDLALHFQINILTFFEENKNKLRVSTDIGPGLMLYSNEGFYCPTDVMIPDDVHGTPGGINTGNAIKMHLGAEISYQITPKVEVFGSIIGHYIFSSEVDGYISYNMAWYEPVKNDYFYSTDVGIRLALYDKNKRVGRSNYQKRRATKAQIPKTKRLSNRRTARQSININKRNEPSRSSSRWQGRKSSW